MLEQTHEVYNVAWVVSDSYIARYTILVSIFLFRSLLSLAYAKFIFNSRIAIYFSVD